MPPSPRHETMVAMIREQPDIVRLLLQELGMELPEALRLHTDSENLSQPMAAEFRADTVLLLGEPDPTLGIIAEVQLGEDDGKRRSWPNYATGVYARFDCECLLVVITPSRSVARWAARPIHVGSGFELRPIVIGPDRIPIVTDPELARRYPELAVLSALAHGDGAPETAAKVLSAVSEGISHLPEDTQALYWDLAESALSQAARKAFAAMITIPENYQFSSPTYHAGKKEGLRVGKKEGLRVGKKEGEITALLLLLNTKFGDVPDSVQTRLRKGTEAELMHWTQRILTASSLDDVF